MHQTQREKNKKDGERKRGMEREEDKPIT